MSHLFLLLGWQSTVDSPQPVVLVGRLLISILHSTCFCLHLYFVPSFSLSFFYSLQVYSFLFFSLYLKRQEDCHRVSFLVLFLFGFFNLFPFHHFHQNQNQIEGNPPNWKHLCHVFKFKWEKVSPFLTWTELEVKDKGKNQKKNFKSKGNSCACPNLEFSFKFKFYSNSNSEDMP